MTKKKPAGKKPFVRRGGLNTKRKLTYTQAPTTTVNAQVKLKEALEAAIEANEAYFSKKPDYLASFERGEKLYETASELPYQAQWRVTEYVFLDRLAILKANIRSRIEGIPLYKTLSEEYLLIATSAKNDGDSGTAKIYLQRARDVFKRSGIPMAQYQEQLELYKSLEKKIYPHGFQQVRL
jgi:hypothetical protein